MSVLNDGNNLPGVIFDVEREVSQDYDPSQFGTTDSVIVIGTAFSGPTNIPTEIYNVDMARYFFGDTYDNDTHRSASLVAGIQAAYDAGCRTIYAMRVGGKDVYKDFRLCEGEDKYRLRIQSIYPTNTAKDCYVRINVASGFESITLYKPAKKATIAEKKSGVVDSVDSVLKTTIYLNEDNGLTRNDRLTELISTFNSNPHNNIFVMSIVDRDGNTVTNDPEAQDLCIGSLFSGVYFVGRDQNSKSMPAYTTLTTMSIVRDSDPKPYSTYEGQFYRKIDFNSDVASDYPIFASSYAEMQNALMAASVVSSSEWDFLETPGLAARAWQFDDIDYEEVELTGYKLYERLGSGFAITAKAVDRGLNKNGKARVPRIVETPADDMNRVVPIRDGVYSLLEDTTVDYRVLVAANADDKITAKLPKADAFKIAIPKKVELLSGTADGNEVNPLIVATPKVESDDLSAAKRFDFHFKKVDEADTEIDSIADVYADKIAKVVGGLKMDAKHMTVSSVMDEELKNGDVANGTMFMVMDTNGVGTLVRASEHSYSVLDVVGLVGELFVIDNKVYVGQEDQIGTDKLLQFHELTGTAIKDATGTQTGFGYKGKNLMLLDSGDTVYVGQIKGDASTADGTAIEISPLGTLESMLGGNDDKTLIYVENSYGKMNHVVISTGAMDFVPLEEFVDIMNKDSVLGKLFKFELTEYGLEVKDMYLDEIEDAFLQDHTGAEPFFEQDVETTAAGGTTTTKHVSGNTYKTGDGANKAIQYDYSKYIPYRTNDNFVRQLAQHCAYSSMRTKTTHGIIGYSPLRNYTLKNISNRVTDLLNADFSLYAKKNNGRMMLDSDNNPYEIGSNVSITVFQHPITDTKTNTTTTVNGAATYAGMISTLPVEQSTTMQPVGISSVDFTFSDAQLRDITNAGYVATKNSTTRGVCICDGVTQAPATEYRRRFSIVRVVNACGDAIRQAAEPYIGKKNSLQNRSALKTAIDSALNEMKDRLIWGYSFEVQNISTYTADSKIDITYKIFPINEIREIENTITVTRQMPAGAVQ